MSNVLAIADDLTGALEVGAKFAGQGIPSLVTLQPVGNISYPVAVIDTESRHLPPNEAAAAVARAVSGTTAQLLYKKTDSTLRGNISAELRALLALRPHSRIVYVPAYPALGRTVRNGSLYVDGVPVHESAFARDALNPIRECSIASLLGDLPCTVCDGECDADVGRAVAEALGSPGFTILAGPASVAEALGEMLDVARQPVRRFPRVARCLIVNGSRHEASALQIEHAESCGFESWRVLRIQIESAAIAGSAVVSYLESPEGAGIDALMVFGGDTAFGILKALGCPPLEPVGEVVTGVPVSRVVGRNLTLITKAGGFCGESLIERVWEALHGNQR